MHMWYQYNLLNRFLVLLFFIVIIIVVVIIVVRMIKNETSSTEQNENKALSILQNRLARGEIDEEEYYRLKKVLEEDR